MFLKHLIYYYFIIVTTLSYLCYAQQHNITKDRPIMHSKLTQPPHLKIGDSVVIVAPSGILNHKEKEINQAKVMLESWGLKVRIGKHVYKKNNHFAGSDSQRIEDFQKALDNPNIAAIWCARGGYGTVRILDNLDYTAFKKRPKWMIGYSDITGLHSQMHNEGIETIHAMMCASMTDNVKTIAHTIDTFKKALFGEPLAYTVKGNSHNKTGHATGQLVGGNLTLLHSMLGSNTSINTADKILFIEEIGEYKYHIDRMLQSLKRAGYFDNCKGLIVGNMSKIRKNTTAWGSSIEQLILDVLEECDFPVLFEFPAGHEKDNRALILGRTITMDVEKAKGIVTFEK
ncbi:MAG: LD-carboxypeptidase [Flavobacteriaceae bacterium]|nr:LD-carboxypeptidase [Flavobacteriaceae bacterium]